MSSLNKINSLTGVRALAACWVLLFHSFNIFYLPQAGLSGFHNSINPLVPAFISHGYFGVDVFFVLSGFVMSYTYFNIFSQPFADTQLLKHTYFEYITNRLARIYPGFLFVFFVSSLLVFAGAIAHPISESQTIQHFLESLPIMLSLSYDLHYANIDAFAMAFWGFNTPLWTVSIEWISYLVFPFLVLFTHRCRWIWLLFSAAVLLFGLQLYIWFDPPRTGELILNTLSFFNFGTRALMRIAADFFLGYLCYRYFLRHPIAPNSILQSNKWYDWLGLTSIGFILLSIYFIQIETITIFFIALFILCCAYSPPTLNGLLGNRVMAYLGEISYSVYLIHYIILQLAINTMIHYQLFPKLITHPWLKALCFLLFITAVLILASGLYHSIERPARKWIRRLPKKLGYSAGRS